MIEDIKFIMKQLQEIPSSERLQAPLPSSYQEQSQLPFPDPKSGKKLYICLFLVTVLIIVLSIHYRSIKYEVAKSPFTEQLQEYKHEEMIAIPHDTQCYTQGLSFINNTHILESCGLYGRSFFHIFELQKGINQTIIPKETYKSRIFDKKYFLEGSVLFPMNNLIYILTWREKVAFRFKSDSYEEVDIISWESDGWGLTHNHTHLIVSDGSDTIYITNQLLQVIEKVKVKDHLGVSKMQLNELEWVQEGDKQYVLANVYKTSEIVKINLHTGQIVESFFFDDLTKKQGKSSYDYVFNGIAYNTSSKNFLLTGKQWRSMYQLQHL